MKNLSVPTIARLRRVDAFPDNTGAKAHARPGLSGGGKSRIGAIGALALAAASTGVVVPVLRVLVENAGRGSISAGVFSAAHVAGGVVGAACGRRALRVSGSTRALALAALTASIIVTLATAAIAPLEIRVGLRFVDGACHLLAITALVAAATAGDADLRARRAMTMGLTIVLGVAGGIGVGALLGHPEAALVVAAGLSAAALLVVVTQIAAEPPPIAPPKSRARGPIAPGLLAFGERFLFGTLTVATPYLASSPRRVGLVIGVFMTASIGALGVARRYALTWGPRRLAGRSTLALALALASTAVIDVFASPGLAVVWAIACGASAGSLYASALVFAAQSSELEDRMRDMAMLSAAGNTGHLLGTLCAGPLISILPRLLVVPLPSIAILAAAIAGVWITVPAVVRSHPAADRHVPPPTAARGERELDAERQRSA